MLIFPVAQNGAIFSCRRHRFTSYRWNYAQPQVPSRRPRSENIQSASWAFTATDITILVYVNTCLSLPFVRAIPVQTDRHIAIITENAEPILGIAVASEPGIEPLPDAAGILAMGLPAAVDVVDGEEVRLRLATAGAFAAIRRDRVPLLPDAVRLAVGLVLLRVAAVSLPLLREQARSLFFDGTSRGSPPTGTAGSIPRTASPQAFLHRGQTGIDPPPFMRTGTVETPGHVAVVTEPRGNRPAGIPAFLEPRDRTLLPSVLLAIFSALPPPWM
jgi:hypothetical protein